MAERMQRATLAAHGLVLGGTYLPRNPKPRSGPRTITGVVKGDGSTEVQYRRPDGWPGFCTLAQFKRWAGGDGALSPRPTTLALPDALARLAALRPGERCTYHRGDLASDAGRSREVKAIRDAALKLREEGRAVFVQRRVAEGEFEYVAVGVRAHG